MALAGTLKATHTTVLSPFDPLVWDRKRVSELFNFDYRIECYTPAPKRQYGYFVLPLLHRGKLVGRMDAKAHRKEGVFEVKSLYLEDGIRVTRTLAQDLAKALQRLADNNKAYETKEGKAEKDPDELDARIGERGKARQNEERQHVEHLVAGIAGQGQWLGQAGHHKGKHEC